jgi:hypothetical protein
MICGSHGTLRDRSHGNILFSEGPFSYLTANLVSELYWYYKNVPIGGYIYPSCSCWESVKLNLAFLIGKRIEGFLNSAQTREAVLLAYLQKLTSLDFRK